MAKKIAVIVNENDVEGIRMSVGLTLADDEVTVFLMDKKVNAADESVAQNLEMLGDLDVKIYTNTPENTGEVLSTEEIAKRLVQFDSVIPY